MCNTDLDKSRTTRHNAPMHAPSRWLCLTALALGCSGHQTFDDGSDEVTRRQNDGTDAEQSGTEPASSVCALPPEQLDGGIDRPGSPPYAECTGCHPTLFFLGEQEGDLPECEVPTETPSEDDFPGRNADDLPCGPCDDGGYRCELAVRPLCDFDGDGPEPEEQNPEYVDNWLCECANGAWDCRIWAASGASCTSPE